MKNFDEIKRNNQLTEYRIYLDNGDFSYNLDKREIYTHNAIIDEINLKQIYPRGFDELIKSKETGLFADEYFGKYGNYLGYKIAKCGNFLEGKIFESKDEHGIYFVASIAEIFEVIFHAADEDFGTKLVTISFENIDMPHIINESKMGLSTECRALKFNVVKVQSLNDYNLIMDLYNLYKQNLRRNYYLCPEIDADLTPEHSFSKTVAYYKSSCPELCRALYDIRKTVKSI